MIRKELQSDLLKLLDKVDLFLQEASLFNPQAMRLMTDVENMIDTIRMESENESTV